jgi:hypothetical protein
MVIQPKGHAHHFTDPVGLEAASFHEGLALTDTKAGFIHVPIGSPVLLRHGGGVTPTVKVTGGTRGRG